MMQRRRFLKASILAGAGLLAGRLPAPARAQGPTPAPSDGDDTPMPASLELSGTIRGVHDPCIIREGDTYHLFCTGPGLTARSSPDLLAWKLHDDVFKTRPAWATEAIAGLDSLWAPDISYYNGLFHLYYSASTFGSNRSAIGLATTPTLDRESPDFAWTDRGMVIESWLTDDWNAIDPNLILDEDGAPWLAFGSHWGGIKLRRLDPDTGLLSAEDDTLYALASRPEKPRAIEAPFIIRHGGAYYLFVSFDACCRGIDSTYNVVVGRAGRVTGPYVDRAGTPMLEGGGARVIAGDEHWRGPGHNAVLQEDSGDKLVYHAYDATFGGLPTLRISPLEWDADGWPFIPPAESPG